MDRRTFLGALAAGTSAALAGCGSSGDGTRPQGTLITGGGGGDGGGDGGLGTSTAPPTTGAQDVFTGVSYDIRGDDGETLTTWTVENTSDRTWSVTVISIVTFRASETGATPRTSRASKRITLAPGDRRTVELRHDGDPNRWQDFRFEFDDLAPA